MRRRDPGWREGEAADVPGRAWMPLGRRLGLPLRSLDGGAAPARKAGRGSRLGLAPRPNGAEATSRGRGPGWRLPKTGASVMRPGRGGRCGGKQGEVPGLVGEGGSVASGGPAGVRVKLRNVPGRVWTSLGRGGAIPLDRRRRRRRLPPRGPAGGAWPRVPAHPRRAGKGLHLPDPPAGVVRARPSPPDDPPPDPAFRPLDRGAGEG